MSDDEDGAVFVSKANRRVIAATSAATSKSLANETAERWAKVSGVTDAMPPQRSSALTAVVVAPAPQAGSTAGNSYSASAPSSNAGTPMEPTDSGRGVGFAPFLGRGRGGGRGGGNQANVQAMRDALAEAHIVGGRWDAGGSGQGANRVQIRRVGGQVGVVMPPPTPSPLSVGVNAAPVVVGNSQTPVAAASANTPAADATEVTTPQPQPQQQQQRYQRAGGDGWD